MLEQLTKFQFDLLKKLANARVKTYCTVAVANGDDMDFNETLQLVQAKLLVDISDKYPDVVKKYSSAQGDDAAVTALTHRGQWMFERTKWEKWLN